ncbi:hypothetical protein [Tritonibacter mobilis]|jgi:hypothetical protein|uniref:hypothetical protein n=1 Tax=Tritonibacter mobilis TaxID=379347 RepID=UPI003A5BC997
MIEYAATAEVKQGMARAHEARAQVLRDALTWMFSRRRESSHGIRISRWASARAS